MGPAEEECQLACTLHLCTVYTTRGDTRLAKLLEGNKSAFLHSRWRESVSVSMVSSQEQTLGVVQQTLPTVPTQGRVHPQ